MPRNIPPLLYDSTADTGSGSGCKACWSCRQRDPKPFAAGLMSATPCFLIKLGTTPLLKVFY